MEIILEAYATDTNNIVETCIYLLFYLLSLKQLIVVLPGTSIAIRKWITLQLRHHLKEILLVAHSAATGFGLSDDNTTDINWRIFEATKFMLAYLHQLHIPEFIGDAVVNATNFLYKIICLHLLYHSASNLHI
jgi:hypothetical protein